jgi:hypothetical protein
VKPPNKIHNQVSRDPDDFDGILGEDEDELL